MPPGRDSFRRNRVAPVQPYFSILACRIPAFASGFRRVHRCTATVSAWYTTATALSCFSSRFISIPTKAQPPLRSACFSGVSYVNASMPPRFEPSTLADLESLLSLMKKMQEADPWSEPFCENTARSNLAQLLQNPAYGIACLVWDSERPIAYLVVCFDDSLEYRGKGAWIDELFVEASRRGQGIGTRLLDLAETLSREHHAQFLHLEVSHGNPAIELYRR